MRRKEFVKRTGAIMLAGMMLCSGVAVGAAQEDQTAETEIDAEKAIEEKTEQEEHADGLPGGTEMPEPVPLEGEKTETENGVIEKISQSVVVEEEIKGEVETLVYTPKGISPTGASTPIIMVYSNEAVTEEKAEERLVSSGLDAIAAKENCSVVFVNPMGGTWSEADAEAYLYTLMDMWSEEANTSGKSSDGTKYVGSTQRIYVIGDGAGADFVNQYLVSDSMQKFFVFANFYYLPTGVILFNPTATQADCSWPVPAVISGGSEELTAAYKVMNKTDGEVEEEAGRVYTNSNTAVNNFMVVEKAAGFDRNVIETGWNQILSKVRRQLTGYTLQEAYELLPVYDYSDCGIQVNQESEEINGTELRWYEYIPEELDLETEGKIPLVFTFHGHGNHAEYQAIASEWPLVAKENGFMVVAPDQYDDTSAEDIVALLENLEAKYPAIDKSRIYVSGFSMGSVKSWTLGTKYPELFAGIAPMDAAPEIDWDVVDKKLPLYYVAGEEDGLLVFPHQQAFGGEGGEGNGDYMIQRIFEMNHIAYPGFDETLNPLWGMEFTKTRTVDTTGDGLHVLTENYMESDDGNTYTVLASMSNQAHAVLKGSSYCAWDFLKKFSRNEDGTISIDE